MDRNIRIEIDRELCKGCKLCVKACFEDILRFDEKEKKAVAAYPEDCLGCLACEGVCSVHAIEVIPTFPVPLPDPYVQSKDSEQQR